MTDFKILTEVFESTPLLSEQKRELDKLKAKDAERELTVSVIGQFKRGKSSLINALLKDDILPVGIIPLTTVVTEIRWGESFKAIVSFNDGSSAEIERKALYLYCSEEENPKNCKNVASVKLFTPSHPFGRDVVLVDTPGVGSVHRHNTVTADEFVEKSDAVIFLLSVDSPVSTTERDFLLKARTFASKFFFAVNKCDVVKEEDLKIFINFASSVISEAMESTVTLKPVSAKEGTGIQSLKEEITKEISSSKENILDESLRKKADILKAQAAAKLSLSIKAASLPCEEIERKLKSIREKQDELSFFTEEVNLSARYRTELLVEKINSGFTQHAEVLKKETEEKCQELYCKYRNLPSKAFEKTMQKELNSFIEEKLKVLNAEGSQLLEEGYKKIAGLLSHKAFSSALFISNALYEEFNLSYPVESHSFEVSQRSDFIMHVGLGGSLLLDKDIINRFLPRSAANKKFLKSCILQAKNDIDFNKSNMVSNYRYKMQESLRIMCSTLTEKIVSMDKEITNLTSHIEDNLSFAEQEKQERVEFLTLILNKLS